MVPDTEARAVIARTLTAAAAAGQLSPSQKRTLAQIVSERTGISQTEAEQRIDQAYKDAVSAIETRAKPRFCRARHGDGLARWLAGRLVCGSERWQSSRQQHASPRDLLCHAGLAPHAHAGALAFVAVAA